MGKHERGSCLRGGCQNLEEDKEEGGIMLQADLSPQNKRGKNVRSEATGHVGKEKTRGEKDGT